MKQNPHIGKYPLLGFYCERPSTRPKKKWKRFIRVEGCKGKESWHHKWKRVSERTWSDLQVYRRELIKATELVKKLAK